MQSTAMKTRYMVKSENRERFIVTVLLMKKDEVRRSEWEGIPAFQ